MKRMFKFVLLGAVAVAVAIVPAAAQVATMSYGSASVTFSPMVDNDGLVLRVSGQGRFFERSFGAGETPSFTTYDADGNLLPDGTYKWELVAMPRRAKVDTEAYASSRVNEDGSNFAAGSAPRAPRQSGVFTIVNGSIADPGLQEAMGGVDSGGEGGFAGVGGGGKQANAAAGPVTYDQVILDDLIVDGSACVGQDCVNGESFGFDTLRLKENNLRIKAQDTSSSASFPSNDWQITFNESSNGGANMFSIDDIDGGRTPFTIEAGAPSNSLYVDDGGKIGFGTRTPVVELHVVNGDTPTLRLEQDGSSGFTAQTFDVAANETNFFIRDATNGSTLPFRIRPGASTSSIDISATGNVGIGNSAPTSLLHLRRGTAKLVVEDTTNASPGTNEVLLELNAQDDVSYNLVHANAATTWQTKNNGNDFQISLVGSGAAEITVRTQGQNSASTQTANTVQIAGGIAAQGFNVFSSRELKTAFAEVDSRQVLAKLRSLPIQEWQYKSDAKGQRHIGPFAEEFNEIFYGRENARLISGTDIDGVALAAIQGLSELVEELEQENRRLASEIEELKKRID